MTIDVTDGIVLKKSNVCLYRNQVHKMKTQLWRKKCNYCAKDARICCPNDQNPTFYTFACIAFTRFYVSPRHVEHTNDTNTLSQKTRYSLDSWDTNQSITSSQKTKSSKKDTNESIKLNGSLDSWEHISSDIQHQVSIFLKKNCPDAEF